MYMGKDSSDNQGDFDSNQYYFNRTENGIHPPGSGGYANGSSSFANLIGGQPPRPVTMNSQLGLRSLVEMQQQQQHFQGGQLRPLPSAGFNSGQSVGATLPGSLSGMYPSSRSGSDMSNLSGLGAVGAANPLLMNGGLRLGMEGSGTYDAQNFPNLASASDFPALPGSQSGLGGPSLKSEVNGNTLHSSGILNSNLSILSQDSQLLHNSTINTFSGVAAVGGASGNSSGTAISRTVGTSASVSLNFANSGSSAASSAQASASTQSQPAMQNLYQGQHIMGGGLGDLSSSSSAIASGTGAPVSAVLSKEGRFGLAGLLDIIRITDKDSTALALGSDLTTYGLNLTSTDCLYASFTSPFNEQPSPVEPHFQTPQCYLLQPTSLKAEHLTKFQIETLFYMFYNMPKDLMQAFAAQELYRREWRFHAELKLWLKVRPPEMVQTHPTVQFVFFDISTWEVRPMTTVYRGNIGAGLVSEEEVRVKILPQGLAGPQSGSGSGQGQSSFLGNT